MRWAEPLGSVGDAQIDELCQLAKALPLDVTGVKGFDNAQVTVGGVSVSEFRADTLESRIAPGVFAAGEVLDIDRGLRRIQPAMGMVERICRW